MSLESSAPQSRSDVLDATSALEALQSSPEFPGPVEPIDGHCCNDHLGLIYETRAERLASVVPFVRQGLERGERVVCIVEDGFASALTDAMRDGGIDVDAAVESGALSFRPVEETYLRNDEFDAEEALGFFTDAIGAACEEYDGLRITAGTSWLQADEVSVEAFMTYEAKVNDLFADEDCVALCQYDRTALPPAVVRDVIRTHPHLVYDGMVVHNAYYTPPAEFVGEQRTAREVDRMLGTLVERAEAKASIEEHGRILREMSAVTSDTDLSFAEKVERLLELGCERFGLSVGTLTRVVADTVDPVETVGVEDDCGDGTDLLSSHCRQLLETGGQVAVRDACSDRDEKFASYLGTTLNVGGETYGTLCFADESPRSEPFGDAEYTFLKLMGQWISYELQREQAAAQLAALNGMSRDLMGHETRAEIVDAAIVHASDTLQLPVTAILSYDEETGSLSPTGQTPRAVDELPTAKLCAQGSGPLWEGFVAEEVRTVDPETLSGAGDAVTEVVGVPLGRHGMFVTAAVGNESFDAAELDFIEAAAATVQAACTRAAREQKLREREETLEEQNETLERLDRINDIIRTIDRGLVEASTRAEVEATVCEQLAEVGPYELAWIGDHDTAADEVTPREWAGAEKGYLDEVEVRTDDSPTGRGPAGRAVVMREPQVTNSTLDDERFAPWRQAALNRGYHSCIAIPLTYEDTLYGVLVVYANRPGVFDDLERTVLTEMADTIAYAINAVESKKAIVSNEVTTLEFTVEDRNLEIVAMARDLGCEFEMESLVPMPNGKLRVFFSTRGVAVEEVLATWSQLAVTELSLIFELDEGEQPFGLFEAVLDEESLCQTVVNHGGRPRTVAVRDGTARVTVDLAPDAAIQEFVHMFRTNYPDSTLVAQRSQERKRRTPTEFFGGLVDALTDRQLEALQTAYFSGYFEEPRLRNASDIADTMGITQPTFNSHLRAAHRNLCGQLFDEGLVGK